MGAESRGATEKGIGIGTPSSLLSGIEFLNTGGSYYQANSVNEDGLTARFTLELPGAPTDADPGAVVVLWQLVVSVADTQFADVTERAIGPPNQVVLQPACETPAGCAVRFDATAPLTSALEADELDWVLSTWVAIRFKLVRTFGDGAFVQAVAPQVGWNIGNGWTITDPADIQGTLISAAVIPVAQAAPAYLPSEEFHYGNDELFDWGSAVSEALLEFPPIDAADAVPEPGPSVPSFDAADAVPEPGPSVPTILVWVLSVTGAATLGFWYGRSARHPPTTRESPPNKPPASNVLESGQ